MAKIAIIGSGFVGQATGKAFLRYGHEVTFVDIDPEKIQTLTSEGYRAMTPEKITEEFFDVFFICVPTPTVDGGIKLSFIQEAAKLVGISLRRLSHYPIVITKCTMPPGTSRKVIIPLLEKYSEKKAGYDFGVAVEPEYLREKTSLQDAECPRLILIGADDSQAANVLSWLRTPFHCPIHTVTLEEAEMQKYVHNIFNATKITFFNEMRQVARKLGFDPQRIFEITALTAEAFWNPRYGLLDKGPYNGSCLPKDTLAFLHFAEEKLGARLPLLSATVQFNDHLTEEYGKNGTISLESPTLGTEAFPLSEGEFRNP